jgi:hypothetical protein
MASMGYCRFENTLRDLEECEEHLEDDLSEREQEARKDLIGLCVKIAEQYGELAET